MGNHFPKRISIVMAMYHYNNKIYVGCHFEKSFQSERNGKLSLCGGHVDDGEKFIDGAMREAREEHGLVKNKEDFLFFETKKINNNDYVYYTVNVVPSDYYHKQISTHDEIIHDIVYINRILDTFPHNSVIKTGSNSVFLIDINVLRSSEYKKYVFEPTYNFLLNY